MVDIVESLRDKLEKLRRDFRSCCVQKNALISKQDSAESPEEKAKIAYDLKTIKEGISRLTSEMVEIEREIPYHL